MKRILYRNSHNDESKDRNRQDLSKRLMHLVSKGQDISKISINDLITDTGISRSNFYNYFDDIYALLEWTYIQELAPQFIEMTNIGMHREAFKYMFYKIYQDRNFYSNIYVFDKESSVDRFLERLTFELYLEEMKNREIKKEDSRWFGSNLAGKTISSMYGTILREWMDSNFTVSTDDIIDFSIFIRNVNIHDVFKGRTK